jgi:hypothetical protein
LSRPQKRRSRHKKGGSGNAVRAGRAHGSKRLQQVQACLRQAIRQGELIGVMFEGDDEPHFLPVDRLDEVLAKPGLVMLAGNDAVTQYVIAKKSAPEPRRLH